jgi:hypothetical protein
LNVAAASQTLVVYAVLLQKLAAELGVSQRGLFPPGFLPISTQFPPAFTQRSNAKELALFKKLGWRHEPFERDVAVTKSRASYNVLNVANYVRIVKGCLTNLSDSLRAGWDSTMSGCENQTQIRLSEIV